jgi:hypothetical protein
LKAVADGGRMRPLARFLWQPDVIFNKIWACPADHQNESLHRLVEPLNPVKIENARP